MKRASVIGWSVAAGGVVVVGVVAWAVLTLSDDPPSSSPSATSSSSPTPGGSVSDDVPGSPVTTTPPTSPGSSASSAPAPDPAPDPAPSLAAVVPLVTFDQWDAGSGTLTVGATVPGVVEAGGTCSVTARNGGLTVDGSFAAVASASSTDCGSMALQSSTFTPGTWSVSVTYASATSTGSVDDYEVTIP
ncbi:hypothetical protein F1C15_14150 [Frigoribacterium sp. NBH87]|uniref:hypothetical protein n=1 Tax=Frigoribacterium sp. NBH87 TaxID=2596916 RepID=UPI0016282AFE|nr:hypothetical protein [Frigoribacterium sp. NBH87]QNE44802.1 hypothetical protein F1C15_14150 [Frigoribacterium sp. NBH87]